MAQTRERTHIRSLAIYIRNSAPEKEQMTVSNIYKKFSQGITWNALFYTFRKGLYLLLTVMLYSKLSTIDFSIWANINSFIFLILLWLDFGFRKSLPRFCPQFAKNKSCMKKFVRYIVQFQSLVLTTAIIIFLLLASTIATKLAILDKIDLLYLGCTLFALEGILAVMRLIYYSYFWQRQFNIQMSIIIMLKSAAVLLFLSLSYTSTALLRLIFISEIAAGICATIIAMAMLTYLYKDKSYPGDQTIDFTKTGKAFIEHSGVMWINNNLKSLTERNFMLLFLTKLLGPYTANLFKLANDGALLFQRVVLKTIGTTDTSLLSHIQAQTDHKKLMPMAFDTLIKRISGFCIPLLGLLLILIINFSYVFRDKFIFELFICITVCYLVEAMLSPYERILEVKRRYWMLAIAYIPYVVFVIAIFLFKTVSLLGLVGTIIFVHTIRLTSYLIMQYIVRTGYNLAFPVKHIAKLTAIAVCIAVITALIIQLLQYVA